MIPTEPAAVRPKYRPDKGTWIRLAVGIPGLLGAACIIAVGSWAYAEAYRENAALSIADQRENVAGGLAMSIGAVLILLGLLAAALVLATVLPRRLPWWLGVIVLIIGGLMLAYCVAWWTEGGDPRGVLMVGYAPIAAIVRMAWQAVHKARLA